MRLEYDKLKIPTFKTRTDVFKDGISKRELKEAKNLLNNWDEIYPYEYYFNQRMQDKLWEERYQIQEEQKKLEEEKKKLSGEPTDQKADKGLSMNKDLLRSKKESAMTFLSKFKKLSKSEKANKLLEISKDADDEIW